jgi:hypothetical protein
VYINNSVVIICSYDWWRSSKSIHAIQNTSVISHVNSYTWWLLLFPCYFPIRACVFREVSSLQKLPPKCRKVVSLLCARSTDCCILLDLLPNVILKSTNYESSHYAIFFNFLLLPLECKCSRRQPRRDVGPHGQDATSQFFRVKQGKSAKQESRSLCRCILWNITPEKCEHCFSVSYYQAILKRETPPVNTESSLHGP